MIEIKNNNNNNHRIHLEVLGDVITIIITTVNFKLNLTKTRLDKKKIIIIIQWTTLIY